MDIVTSRYNAATVLLSVLLVRSREDTEALLDILVIWNEMLDDLIAMSVDIVQQDTADPEKPLNFSQGVASISETLVELIQDRAVKSLAPHDRAMADRLNHVVFDHQGVPGRVVGNESGASESEIERLIQFMRKRE